MSSKRSGEQIPLDVDPVTLEIVRSMTDSVAEEMTASLIRTAYSTNIKDRKDCSTAVYNRDGEMISQKARGSPIHIGTMKFAISRILEVIDIEEMGAGDVFIYNTPYPVGPHHLNDVTIAAPLFVDDEVYAFFASQAHHVDMGGTEPGSMPFGVTEIYQEGLQIPPVHLMRGGEVNDEVFDIVKENVRTARVTEGDLWAQVAAANTGKRSFEELIDKFGAKETKRYTNEVIDYAERRMRQEIQEKLPNGTFEFEDYVEGDSIDDVLINIHGEITVDDDSVIVDLSESHDQVRGPLNYRPPAVIACVQYAIQALVDPNIPVNEGTTRPIEVITRKGSVLESEYPAPQSNAGMVTSQRIVDVVIGALIDAVPERALAASSGTIHLFNIGGIHPETDEYFNYVETYGGGQGAMSDKDGMDGVHNHMPNTQNAPAEVLEHTYPFIIEEYSLVENSEGAGKYRGGMGIEREIRITSEEVRITLSTDRMKIAPWGVYGGHDASPSECFVIHSNGEKRELPSKISMRFEDKNARIVSRTPGGGGWGDPFERDSEKVRKDVEAGLISRDRAREDYGVSITEDLEINEEETHQLHKRNRSS